MGSGFRFVGIMASSLFVLSFVNRVGCLLRFIVTFVSIVIMN